MKETYWLIVKDGDQKKVAIVGPVVDDSFFADKVCKLRKEGKQIWIDSVSTQKESKENLIKYHSSGMRFVELREILS